MLQGVCYSYKVRYEWVRVEHSLPNVPKITLSVVTADFFRMSGVIKL